MRKLISLLVVLQLTLFSSVFAQTYSTFSAFKTAVAAATPGSVIILADGVYEASTVTMDTKTGTAENPIIVRAETIGGVTLNTDAGFDLRHCSYVTIQGFVFNMIDKSTVCKIQTCDNVTITQNVFNGENEIGTSSVWVMIQAYYNDLVNLSHHNKVSHNVFKNKHTLGNMIRIDGTNELYVSQYDVIEYNYFKNLGPRAVNDNEAIRIGWSAMSESDGFCTVSNNLFEECNGDPEIVSVKCNKNTISHNTFRRCQGTLSLRHGNNSLVEGNFFLGEGEPGTGGVRIYGRDHKIINNYFEGLTGTRWDAPITLTEGDVDSTSTNLSGHYRIERAIIANNTLVDNDFGIEIGYNNSGAYTKPPRDVVMAYNIVSGTTNSLVNYINAPTNMLWIDNIMNATGTAVVGTNVTFTTDQATEQDPNLTLDGHYKATLTTPQYTPASTAVGNIINDIDGQLRSIPTNYGADEYSTDAVVYEPLSAADVGPSTGEYLYVSTHALSFYTAGAVSVVSVSSNLNWAVADTITWLSVSPMSGSTDGSFLITIDENTTGLDRSGGLTVSSTNSSESSELEEIIIISQLGVDPPYINLSETDLSFTTDAGVDTFLVTSNVSWIAVSDALWATINKASGSNNDSIIVSVEENTLLTPRSAIITVSDGAALTKTITVTQDAFVGTEIKLTIATAVASTEQNEPGKVNIASNVIDGDFSTRWSGQGDSAYITLDLNDLYEVSFVKVGLYSGATRTCTFDIQTSENGTDFSDALMGITSYLTSEPLVLYDFSDINARYVRIIGHGNSTSDWNSYTEFEVWGWEIPIDTLTNTDLSEIRVDGIAIPDFSRSTLEYIYEVPYGTTTIPVVTATTRVLDADVVVTQAGSIPGTASLLVTAKDLVTTNTYHVEIVETPPSNNPELSGITVDDIPLAGFDAAILTYIYEVPIGTTNVPFIDATTESDSAKTSIAQASAIGDTATVIVTAQDKISTKKYEIIIKEQIASALGDGTINYEFIYPNPSNGVFTISNCEGANVIIYNTSGKIVYTKNNISRTELLETSLTKGIYMVVVRSVDKNSTAKIIVE